VEGGGGKGVHFFSGYVFFRCEEAREGKRVIFFYKIILGRGKGCTGGKGVGCLFHVLVFSILICLSSFFYVFIYLFI